MRGENERQDVVVVCQLFRVEDVDAVAGKDGEVEGKYVALEFGQGVALAPRCQTEAVRRPCSRAFELDDVPVASVAVVVAGEGECCLLRL